MRIILVLLLVVPTLVFSQKANDSIINILQQQQIENLNENFQELQKKYDYQVSLNELTVNSISDQIGATSFNLSIFAILFGVLAIILGVYVTWVERKIIGIKEENESLLKETKDTKNEVVSINELIQKDIYGLFLKIKREETRHILNRLVKIPEDISNLTNELLSRELHEEDFLMLKKAYLNLKPQEGRPERFLSFTMDYKESYLLLFFQHFLGLSTKDEQIGPDLINFYSQGVTCAFENDMIKSTEDFMKAIIDLGYQSRSAEVNSYAKALSSSTFKNFDKVYNIIFDSLKTRNERFKFYEIIDTSKEARVAKKNLGLRLISSYSNTETTDTEKGAFEETKRIIAELEKEEEERRVSEEKEKAEQEKRRLAKEANQTGASEENKK